MKKYYVFVIFNLLTHSLICQTVSDRNSDYQSDTVQVIYEIVDEMPLFDRKGDMNDLQCFILKNIEISDSLGCMITKCRITFIVEPSGIITNKEILIEAGNVICDSRTVESSKKYFAEMLMKVLNKIPTFEAGKLNGEKVPVKITVPLNLDYN